MKNSNVNSKKLKANFINECPNCWGYQEYNGKFIQNIFHKSIGWIQEYFNKYLNK